MSDTCPYCWNPPATHLFTYSCGTNDYSGTVVQTDYCRHLCEVRETARKRAAEKAERAEQPNQD